MQQALRRSGLVPTGFVVESAFCDTDTTVITVRLAQSFGLCPSCGTVSRRVHSHYRRRVRDLPLSGRTVELVIIARRFRCEAVLCGRQIFTERFAEGILAPSARRTTRLDGIVRHLGLALGGKPAAMFAKRLMLPASNDILLRVVRRRSRPPSDPLRVVGIDDWTWRRIIHTPALSVTWKGAGSSRCCRIENRRPPKRCLPTIRQLGSSTRTREPF
jgi:hypothetical protein